MTLTEFLRARLDADEAAAKAWLPFGNPDEAARNHIARHDPARVLDEVEAKRRIVRDYEQDVFHSTDVLRILAAVYADHPDYDESWRP